MAIESVETSFKLQDRTAILTGPCNSYNQSIALKFTQMGANIALIDRNVERTQRFAEQLMDAREVHEKYGRATAIQADLSKPHHVQDAISRAAESFGGIDIYVDGLMTSDLRRFKDPNALDDLDYIMDVNLRSVLMMTHGVLRFLEGRRRGRVIYLMHDIVRLGLPANSLLAATRTGLTAFARTLSREVASDNVTVNCVGLGLTEEFLQQYGSMASAGSGSNLNLQEAQRMLAQIFPHATLTEPDKIANVIAFLASPLGAGITGQTIAVSQGLSFLS